MDPGSTSEPVPKRCGTRTLGCTPSVPTRKRCVKSGIIFKCQLLTPFTSGPWLQKWPGSKTVWNPVTGVDTKCPAMEQMCQIMFYNQLPTSDTIHKWTFAPEVGQFHIGALTDVEPGHWGRHQVSSHETELSNHVL